MDDNRLVEYLALWMGVVVFILLAQGRRRTASAGLVTAYVFDLWLIHGLAAGFYLLPWYQGADPRLVQAGLEQSLYGIAAFAFGSVFLVPVLMNMGMSPRGVQTHQPDRNLPMGYVVTGVIFYILLSTALAKLPSAT